MHFFSTLSTIFWMWHMDWKAKNCFTLCLPLLFFFQGWNSAAIIDLRHLVQIIKSSFKVRKKGIGCDAFVRRLVFIIHYLSSLEFPLVSIGIDSWIIADFILFAYKYCGNQMEWNGYSLKQFCRKTKKGKCIKQVRLMRKFSSCIQQSLPYCSFLFESWFILLPLTWTDASIYYGLKGLIHSFFLLDHMNLSFIIIC